MVERIYERLMMELEQRVQALEQELQILKNQIQVMLLDIQEQVLSNTYPDLRSGESPAQDNRSVSRPEPEVEVHKRPSTPVHKVSFDDFAAEENPVSPRPSVKSNNQATWQGMAGLEAWVSEKIETVGLQETIDLIHMYATNGRFSPEVQDSLLQFAAFKGNQYPADTPTQPSRSAVFNTAPVASPKPPAKKAAPVRSVPASPAPQSVAPPKASTPAKPVNKKKVAKPKVEEPKPAEDGSHNIVLKLIAGVQNAGAGVRWGKNNDG
jgi:hypothetical protein